MKTFLLVPGVSHTYALWICALLAIVCAGASGLLTWFAQRPKVTRLLVFALVALLVSGGVSYAAYCCSECDPWWAQFWICIPSY